ncbi:nuclear transport factor 2 family protein [Nocardioides sp.]|uniref:nuclear transport factor 2 family protein n=1 Tax=Nocardioides sp. TaxID=35761 RepID=UPI001A35C955|nr:nuclear transport factor 2 family protein [Nocardioides sp.]MBJ7356034.1 nuclear transport factor 2 family protein [Nocardioides sp.]
MSKIIRTADDLAQYLIDYPREIAFGDEPPETVLDRYHTPDYVVVNDGIELDRQRLLDHVRPARKRAADVGVEVHDALVVGDRVAARFVLTAQLRKGTEVATEVHMFGTLAPDGRLRRADQITRTL